MWEYLQCTYILSCEYDKVYVKILTMHNTMHQEKRKKKFYKFLIIIIICITSITCLINILERFLMMFGADGGTSRIDWNVHHDDSDFCLQTSSIMWNIHDIHNISIFVIFRTFAFYYFCDLLVNRKCELTLRKICLDCDSWGMFEPCE